MNLRAVGPMKPLHPFGAYLAFDHDGSAVKFGLGVAGSDADRVLMAIAAAVRAWTAQDPARPPAAVAPSSKSGAWSRVTLLIAALSVACLLDVALAWPPDPTKMTFALAVGIISSAFIPMWAFIVLNLESRVLWLTRIWVRLAAVLYIGGGLLVSVQVMIWVSDGLLSPFRAVDEGDLHAIWLVNVLLCVAGMFWTAHRADKRGWPLREERRVSRNTSGQ